MKKDIQILSTIKSNPSALNMNIISCMFIRWKYWPSVNWHSLITADRSPARGQNFKCLLLAFDWNIYHELSKNKILIFSRWFFVYLKRIFFSIRLLKLSSTSFIYENITNAFIPWHTWPRAMMFWSTNLTSVILNIISFMQKKREREWGYEWRMRENKNIKIEKAKQKKTSKQN